MDFDRPETPRCAVEFQSENYRFEDRARTPAEQAMGR